MSSWDGTELFYRAWWPEGKKAKKALLLFHRGHEHSGRWQETVDSLGLDDVAIFAWDARGHGRSAGERGAARDLADMVKDVAAFVRQIAQRYGIALENMIVLAHSLGGGNGDRVGARLRAADSRAHSGDGGVRGETLRSSRHPGAAFTAEAFRGGQDEELRPGENVDPRSGGGGAL